jgi:hypothetical protein
LPDGSPWRGDECGCTDDQCAGYHHDQSEPCGCLPALIDDDWKTIHAGEEARDVWALHEHAVTTGLAKDRDTAQARLAEWIRTYKPGAIAFEFTDRGITYRNKFNNETWLTWDAATGNAMNQAAQRGTNI